MDLIEKQHPAVCRLKRPRFIALGTGKRAFDVAKQVGGQQLRITRILRAVKAHKGHRAPAARAMANSCISSAI